jgi:hypothetical protein
LHGVYGVWVSIEAKTRSGGGETGNFQNVGVLAGFLAGKLSGEPVGVVLPIDFTGETEEFNLRDFTGEVPAADGEWGMTISFSGQPM